MNGIGTWNPVVLGKCLGQLRCARNLTKAELARKSGTPASALSLYESGQKFPELPTLFKLLHALNCRLADLDSARDFLAGLDGYEEQGGGLEAEGPPPGSPGEAAPVRSTALSDLVRALAAETGYPLPEDRGRALELWDRLKGYSHEARLALVAENREFQLWSLSELIAHKSEAAASEDAGEAVRLAHLALDVASQVPGEELSRFRSRGYARHHLGNAFRVQGELRSAKTVFMEAEEEWRAGEGCPGDLLCEARLLDLKSSFLTAERELPGALDLLDRALAAGEPGMKGRLLIKKSKAMEEQDDLEAAVALLKQAEPFVDEHREPRLWLCLRHNLLDLQSKIGRFLEAEALIPEVRRLSQTQGKELDRVRLQWAEGRVEAGLGRMQQGIDHLSRVRAEFVNRKIWYDAALVTLELTALFLKDGRTGMVKTLASHLKPIFQAQGVHREALAALTLFTKAADQEKATLDMAEGLVTYLRRARHDPGLKFQAAR